MSHKIRYIGVKFNEISWSYDEILLTTCFGLCIRPSSCHTIYNLFEEAIQYES